MKPDNYCIKDGYKHRTTANTSLEDGANYWNAYRIKSSQYYQYHVYKLARKYILNDKLTSCIDIGCGSGYKLAKMISPICDRVVGVDQPHIIEICRNIYKESNVQWRIEDLENPTQTEGEKFDLIVSADVIEHLLEPDQLLRRIKKAAHKDSLILISTPERDLMHGEGNNEPVNSEHIREWNQAEFKLYLESRGFEVLEIKLLPGIKFHIGRRYFNHLRKNFRNLNFNMLAICRARE